MNIKNNFKYLIFRELTKVRQRPESEIHYETILWEEEASAKGREGPELGLWTLITSPEHRLPLLLVCALQVTCLFKCFIFFYFFYFFTYD